MGNNKVKKGIIIELADLTAVISLNISINKTAHIRLVRFQINKISACVSDRFFQCSVEHYFLFNVRLLRERITGIIHIPLYFCVGTNKAVYKLVQFFTASGAGFVVNPAHSVFTAEIMDIVNFGLRCRYSSAEVVELFKCCVKILFCFCKTILDQAFNVFGIVTLKSSGSVFINSISQIPKQLLVVHDISEVLFFSVKTVNPAYCLKESVIVH